MRIRTKHAKTVYFNIFFVTSLVIMCLMCGCADSGRIMHPIEVISPKESSEEDLSGEENPANTENVSENTDENADIRNDFVLLKPTEPDLMQDENGLFLTPDGKKVVDLVFFMGQSNMSGAGGDASLAPVVPMNHGYEFKAVSDPSRLYPITEPFGQYESFVGGICDLPGVKKGSLVSSFANEYYYLTNVPIVAVSASQGATTSAMWQSIAYQTDIVTRAQNAITWLEANDYHIRRRYAVWLQGESDAANNVDPEVYTTNLDNIIRPLFMLGLHKVFIITPGRTISIKDYFAGIIEQQLKMCKESGYYALGTNVLSGISTKYMVDEWHYNQQVLNLLGIETARSAAYYTVEKKERIDYNYRDGETFIPDGFGYSGDEIAEPYDLSDLWSLTGEN